MKKKNDFEFQFEHLVFLSNRDLWLLLAETDNVTILQACQGVDNYVLVRIRSVFSKLACDYFNDDLSKFWATRDEDIVAARSKMSKTLRRLYRQGRIKDWDIQYAA